MSASTAEPTLSWLTLERYALGELDEPTRRAVEAQLSRSAADRAALRAIQEDTSELPALPLPAPRGQGANLAHLREGCAPVVVRAPRRRRSWPLLGGVLAAAAALLLMQRSPTALPPTHRHLKGGELALSVVNERGVPAESFAPGERLKLVVSCPVDLSGMLDAAIFQAGQRFQPLPNGANVACGNGVGWPGAFTLDGAADAHVCVAEGARLARATNAADLTDHGVCVRLPARK